LPTEYVYVIAGGTALAAIPAAALLLKRRRYPAKRSNEDSVANAALL